MANLTRATMLALASQWFAWPLLRQASTGTSASSAYGHVALQDFDPGAIRSFDKGDVRSRPHRSGLLQDHNTFGAQLIDRRVQVLDDDAEMVVAIADLFAVGADLIRWTSS